MGFSLLKSTTVFFAVLISRAIAAYLQDSMMHFSFPKDSCNIQPADVARAEPGAGNIRDNGLMST